MWLTSLHADGLQTWMTFWPTFSFGQQGWTFKMVSLVNIKLKLEKKKKRTIKVIPMIFLFQWDSGNSDDATSRWKVSYSWMRSGNRVEWNLLYLKMRPSYSGQWKRKRAAKENGAFFSASSEPIQMQDLLHSIAIQTADKQQTALLCVLHKVALVLLQQLFIFSRLKH